MTSRHFLDRRWAVSLAVAGALFAAGGCAAGSSSTAAGSAGTQGQAAASPGSGSHAATAAPAAPAPVNGTCPASTALAHIGGAATCLAPGQACDKTHRDEYPGFGFLCLPQSNRYVLQRK